MSDNQLSYQELQQMLNDSRQAFRKGTLRLYANDTPEGIEEAVPMRLQGQDHDGRPIDLAIDTVGKIRTLLGKIRFLVSDPLRDEKRVVEGQRWERRNNFLNLVTDAEFIRKAADGKELKPLRLVLNQRANIVLLAVACGADVIGLRPAQRSGNQQAAPENSDFDSFIGALESGTDQPSTTDVEVESEFSRGQ